MKIVMTDPPRVQCADQLVQEIEEVLGERLSERQSRAVDPLTKKDIAFLGDDAITRGSPSALILNSAGDADQAIEPLEGALLTLRQKTSDHTGERERSARSHATGEPRPILSDEPLHSPEGVSLEDSIYLPGTHAPPIVRALGLPSS